MSLRWSHTVRYPLTRHHSPISPSKVQFDLLFSFLYIGWEKGVPKMSLGEKAVLTITR
jgi:hypothetical protein